MQGGGVIFKLLFSLKTFACFFNSYGGKGTPPPPSSIKKKNFQKKWLGGKQKKTLI